MIRKCSPNTEYLVGDDHIYGSSRPILQGGLKLLKKPSERVMKIPLPTDIFLNHKNIELYFNFFYMHEMPFLYINSSKITSLITENFILKSAYKMIKELHKITNMYKSRGFNIDVYHRDKKIDINDLREHISPASLDICEKGRHINIIER